MSLAARVSDLATGIANYLRDSVLPRLLPTGGTTGQLLRKASTGFEWFTQTFTTDAVGEGTTNLYFTLTRVLNAAMTGLSTATSTAVVATDTLLGAIGKLQAQVTLRALIASPTFTGTPAAPTAATGTNTTQLATTAFVTTAANNSKNPQVQSAAAPTTVTPAATNDMVAVTGLAAALTIANVSGTAVDGWGLVIRIKDNGTARALTWGTIYRAMGTTLPTTTVAGKTMYLGLVYNATDTKWDLLVSGVEA